MPSVKWAFDRRHGAAITLVVGGSPTLVVVADDRRLVTISWAHAPSVEIDLYAPVNVSHSGPVAPTRSGGGGVMGTLTFRLSTDETSWPRLTASRTCPPWLMVAWDLWNDDDDEGEGEGQYDAAAADDADDPYIDDVVDGIVAAHDDDAAIIAAAHDDDDDAAIIAAAHYDDDAAIIAAHEKSDCFV